MMPHGRHVNSLATPYHMPIFDALALVRSPHLRGLAAAQGDFHDLWPRTAARDLTTMGFLRHWGDVVFVNTIHPNRAQRTVKLSPCSGPRQTRARIRHADVNSVLFTIASLAPTLAATLTYAATTHLAAFPATSMVATDTSPVYSAALQRGQRRLQVEPRSAAHRAQPPP